MKIRALACIFCSVILLVIVQSTLSQSDGWETVAPGIEYREFELPDPNRIYVARMDRSRGNLTIDSALAHGDLGAGPEIVSKMSQRYEDTINYWGGQAWGARNHVVVAINGSYIDREGYPQSGQIISGWYAKRFDNLGGGSGFAWKLDRTAFIGGCVNHLPEKQYIQNILTREILEIAAVNRIREPEGLFLYTPQWGSNTGTLNVGVEVLVELTRPAMVYPGPRVFIQGYVRDIRDRLGSTYIPFDHVVLSARGNTRERLLQMIKIGDEIGINQEITHFESDCQTRRSESWTTTYASISGDYVFLENGNIRDFDGNAGATNRHPRTAIVYNDAYIYFVVVDGRQPETSVGMTITELATFARDTLGVAWGIALDGGGSSTMVVNGIVKNHPSDPCNRIFLPVVGQESTGSARRIPAPSSPKVVHVSPTCERPVVNGMMMIVVEPKIQSAVFSPGDPVIALSNIALRLGPGTNYAPLATVPQGVPGTILPHFNRLDGVLAKGTYWWKVSFGGAVGWAPQEALSHPYLDFLQALWPE